MTIKLIQILSEKISEEIHDGKSYVRMAMEYRDEYPGLAKLLYTLSQEEMDHMNRLHSAVVEIIEAYRNEKGDPPPAMLAVYDYLHKQQIEKAADVKAMQSLFTER